MTLASALLPRFLEVYPFQPATAIWRAVEIATLAEAGLPAGRGLDLGCGDGLLTSLVLEACGAADSEHEISGDLVGIDPDPAEIELARASGIYRELFTAGGDAIPQPDGSFDWVLSNSVLEHIPDVAPVLADAARVLKMGGQCVLTVPSTGFHRLLRGPLYFSAHGAARREYLCEIDRRCAHFYYWDEAKWRAELGRVGLELVEARPYLNRAQTQRWETISRFTAGLLVLAFRGKKRPIEIQRTLGMRTPGRQMPPQLAQILARLLSFGVRLDAPRPKTGACLLLRAVKIAPPQEI